MKNYAEMTDFEINKAVAEVIYPGKEFTAAYSFGFPLGPQVQWIQGYGEFLRKDYCNSWADAGRLIEGHQISIDAIYEGGSRWLSFAGDDGEFRHIDSNPLRAAMIVFLMMNGHD